MRLFQSVLRGDVLEGCVGRRERRVRESRIDFSKQLVLYHLVASLDFERLKLAGGLCADVNVQDGLQHARRNYRAFYIAAHDGRRGVNYLGFAEHPVIPERACTSDQECAN